MSHATPWPLHFTSRALSTAIAAMALLGLLEGLAPGRPWAAPAPRLDYLSRVESVDLERVVVQFREELGVRVRGGRLESVRGADLSAALAVAASLPGAEWQRRWPRTEVELDLERARGEARTHLALPDLNSFLLLQLPATANDPETRLRSVLDRLNGTPGVVAAFAVPKGSLAGFRELRLTPPQLALEPRLDHRGGVPGALSSTPDFSPQQGYLYASPIGINADAVWPEAGGMGQGVKMIDLEFGWLFTHEDLKPAWYYGGAPAVADHGTAVLGEFGGQHNGYGINGIAPEMQIGAINTDDLAARIAEANGVLSPGDLYLIEIQVSGPENWMPMEWIPDVFAAIQTSTALGIVCIEAGANGTVNLDDALYGDTFNRRVRDSGAIMVGAGTPNGLDAEWFSDYGSRLDLQGWGSSIVTSCCGDLQGGAPEVQYTAGFNGTSGASPIVTGSVGSLQGQCLALYARPLTPALAEEILSTTGSPWVGAKQIGERPNLAAARERLLLGIGDLDVTVRDAVTHAPLPGLVVQVVETGRIELTGPSGEIAMQCTAAPMTLRIAGNFFYADEDFPVSVPPNQLTQVILDLDPLPKGSLTGRVRDQRGAPLGNARVLVMSTPLDTTNTAPNGSYSVNDLPARAGYVAISGWSAAHGAAATTFDVVGTAATGWSPVLVDAQTFESTNGGYTPTNEWQWGTPTFPINNPPNPPSGDKCWGVDLAGAYDDLKTSVLTSPVFDLTAATHLTLSFTHYYWIESDDGGNLQVWDAAQNKWVVVQPVGGYPDGNVLIMPNQPAYNGRLFGWHPAVFNLDAYAGHSFQFRFYFKSNVSGHKLGWYIDDVALDTGQGSAVSVHPEEFSSGLGPTLAVSPSPFATGTTFLLSLGSSGPADLRIFGIDGRVVRRFVVRADAAGRGQVEWDGRDEAGRELPNGLYFARLRQGEVERQVRVLRVR